MRNRWVRSVWYVLLLALATTPALAQSAAVDFPPSGGVATLYARDAQLATLSLLDGKSGMVVRDDVVYNRDTHLAFDIYEKDSLRVGVQGLQQGTIVDLGSAEELEARYGYEETVGKSQGFASIHREAGRLVVLKDYRARQFQALREERLLTRESGSESAAVVVGHIYVVRVIERGAEIVCAKLRVLAFTPGQSVTIRWEGL
jgi:hypothetical protein